MPYTCETLQWQSFDIEVRYHPDPFHLTSRGQAAMAHIEIRIIKPARAALPITETGYRSHYTPKAIVDGFDSPGVFVVEWLEVAAQAENWQAALADQRQLCLF